ncbi:5'-nucleotidase C-terminal domain-containing protein [Aeromicrobium endophyticum]|uniref:5'-nucleotidase C-terminal domain-containing protein n=1 Tax=Aeromicrobium endophyticum TaxID=2292704 RepID=UPI00131451D3|nr:5'-nucleotidase C-terminal domain-containing protein [Aeromicrobium endophyticum]
MSSPSRRLLAVATATLLGAPLLTVTPAVAADDVTVNLVGINDFHGRIDENTVQWAGTIKQLEGEAPGNSLLVSAGDNIGASLFTSAVDDDNPTIDVLNSVGLDATATGNHEFDKGYDDLVGRVIPRADFPILGANVKKSDGSAALDASATFDIDGVKIAVIGAVTQETPALVSPAGIEGLTFGDPVAGINAEATRLKGLPEAQRPDVMVASFHEGAPDGALTLPQAIEGSMVFRHLVEDTSADVDAIFMGHTHQKYAYSAPVPGASGKTRPIIQTGNYGENVGQIKLKVNPDTGDVTSFTLKNTARLTTPDADLIKLYPELAEVKTIRDDAVTAADKVGSVPKGTITADITRAFVDGTTEDRASESTAGGLVADALLETVAGQPAGADLGIVNPGGLRPPDLTYKGVAGSQTNTDGVVTFAELNSVLPFANNLNSVRLSGASLKKVLEQQWQRDASGNVPTRPYLQLGVSKNVHVTYDATRPEGRRVTSVTIDGKPLQADQQYKVATFSFLATGGDNFRAFKEGVNTDTGLVDRDGWITYFEKNSPISPDFARRTVETRGLEDAYEQGERVSATFPKLDLTSLGSPKNTTVTATLTSGGTTTALGSFPVSNGSATVGFDVPAGATGSATLSVTAAPTGTTASVPFAIKIPSTVTGTVPAKARTGTSFTVDAVVDSAAEAAPSGTVSVKDGDTVVGTGTLSGGTATVSVDASKLTVGERALTLSYSGDDDTASSSSAAGTIEIVKGSSGIAASPASGTYGKATTIRLTADSEASGLVYVTQDGRMVGLGFLYAGAGGVTLDGVALAPGSYGLEVYYGGDEKFDPTTVTTSATIAKGATSLRKASVSPAKIVRNRTKPFVTVSVRGDGFTVDGGTVTLRQGGKSYRATVNDGKARVRLGRFTSSGAKKKVTASYSGNSVANGSSSTFTVKVLKK